METIKQQLTIKIYLQAVLLISWMKDTFFDPHHSSCLLSITVNKEPFCTHAYSSKKLLVGGTIFDVY